MRSVFYSKEGAGTHDVAEKLSAKICENLENRFCRMYIINTINLNTRQSP
jgi:hypothetical protein